MVKILSVFRPFGLFSVKPHFLCHAVCKRENLLEIVLNRDGRSGFAIVLMDVGVICLM